MSVISPRSLDDIDFMLQDFQRDSMRRKLPNMSMDELQEAICLAARRDEDWMLDVLYEELARRAS